MISLKFLARAGFAALAFAPLALAGCSPTGAPEAPAAAVVAGAAVAAPVVPAVAVKPAEQAPDGVLVGALGSKLNEADRKAAFTAQLAALSSGQRKTWRGGAGGAFGYVEPGAETPGLKGNCRSYAHTVYFGGRPQSASGQACREADGTWTGDMFDGMGFVRGAERKGEVLRGRRVALFGAGGAGSAIGCELAAAGVASLAIIDPQTERAAALARTLRDTFPDCRIEAAAAVPRDTNMIVNASTVGITQSWKR